MELRKLGCELTVCKVKKLRAVDLEQERSRSR